MTQNTEQNTWTREDREQEIAIMLCKARGRDPFQMTYQTIEPGIMEPYGDAWCHYIPEAKAVLEWHEAEAQGAEEQRRKDGELSRDAIADIVEGMSVSIDVSTGDDDAGNRLFGTVGETQYHSGDKHDLTLLVIDPEPNFKPANVAALEARIVELEGQITALNTPQYYAVEGDDFAQNSIADIFDDCDAERNTIIQVNGYRQVSSEWALFDGESLHVFPTENEAEAAHAALTREGGV